MTSKPRLQIKTIHPYQPGLPIDYITKRYGIAAEAVVKLASNENPFGPSPKALQAIQQMATSAHRYPDQYDLLHQLAVLHNLAPGRLVLGNGSNDVLDLVARAYLGPGDEAISAQYSFIVYQLATQAIGARNSIVPARQYGHDLSAMLQAVTSATKVIWIANPNNPTGTFLPYAQVEDFLTQLPPEIIVVLDEAYYDYLTPKNRVDTVKWLDVFQNLILVRTFSKIYGLAGLRIGYGMTSPEIGDYLNRVRQPFNVSTIGLVAAQAALSDKDFVTKSYQANLDGKAQIMAGLKRLAIDYLPAYGNFITFKVASAQLIYEKLLCHGVIVRPLDGYGMEQWLRVTVGLPVENDQFLTTLKNILEKL